MGAVQMLAGRLSRLDVPPQVQQTCGVERGDLGHAVDGRPSPRLYDNHFGPARAADVDRTPERRLGGRQQKALSARREFA